MHFIAKYSSIQANENKQDSVQCLQVFEVYIIEKATKLANNSPQL